MPLLVIEKKAPSQVCDSVRYQEKMYSQVDDC